MRRFMWLGLSSVCSAMSMLLLVGVCLGAMTEIASAESEGTLPTNNCVGCPKPCGVGLFCDSPPGCTAGPDCTASCSCKKLSQGCLCTN